MTFDEIFRNYNMAKLNSLNENNVKSLKQNTKLKLWILIKPQILVKLWALVKLAMNTTKGHGILSIILKVQKYSKSYKMNF